MSVNGASSLGTDSLVNRHSRACPLIAFQYSIEVGTVKH